MSMQSLISIIIPVYNHEQALEKALGSIFEQTYKDIEVIVVDDGSEEVISPKSKVISQMRVIRQDHKGAAAARNRGLEEVKGEYVIFWDADVIAEPEMLEKMIRALRTNPEASFVYSNFYFGWKKMKGGSYEATKLQRNNYIHSTSLIRRKEAIQWDESLKRFQDWNYWLSMAEQGKKGIWIDEYLFRVLPGGTMSSWLPKLAYKKPWRWMPGIRGKVRRYEEAREVVMEKHGLDRTRM